MVIDEKSTFGVALTVYTGHFLEFRNSSFGLVVHCIDIFGLANAILFIKVWFFFLMGWGGTLE